MAATPNVTRRGSVAGTKCYKQMFYALSERILCLHAVSRNCCNLPPLFSNSFRKFLIINNKSFYKVPRIIKVHRKKIPPQSSIELKSGWSLFDYSNHKSCKSFALPNNTKKCLLEKYFSSWGIAYFFLWHF